MNTMTRLGPLLTFLAAMLLVQPALASSHKSNDGFLDVSTIKLLPGWMREDGLYMAAIQVDMIPGWKTYWRQPGAGGIAPSFNWTGSQNLEQVGYFWPTPEVFEAYGTSTIGYDHQLILPILLRPRDASKNIQARLTMEYGVCDDICVPVMGKATGTFAPAQIANRDAIGQAVAQRPRSGRAAGMTTATCTITPEGEDYVLSAQFDFSSNVGTLRAVVVETGSDTLWVSDADHRSDGGSIEVEADLRNYADGPLALDRHALRFTLIGMKYAVDIQGCSGR